MKPMTRAPQVFESAVFFSALAENAEAVSTVLNLQAWVQPKALLTPAALAFDSDPPPDLLVTQILIRSTEHPLEQSQRIYKGPAVPLGRLMEAFSPAAMKYVELSLLILPAGDGMELVFIYSNGSTAFTSKIVWDVHADRVTGVELNPEDASHCEGGDVRFRPGVGWSPDAHAAPPTHGDYIFELPDGSEILRIKPNGSFLVHGELVAEGNYELYNTFAQWMKAATEVEDA